MTNVMLVSSGHAWSTYDIFQYYLAAFKKLDVKIKPFRYLFERDLFNRVINELRDTDNKDYSAESTFLASRAMLGELAIVQPDILIIVTATTLFADAFDWIEHYKQITRKPFKTVLLLTESPYETGGELGVAYRADMVFTNEITFLRWLRRMQPFSYYLPHVYSEDVHYPAAVNKETDIFFCGSQTTQRMVHFRDAKLYDLNFKLIGYFPSIKEGFVPELMDCYEEGNIPNGIVANHFRGTKIGLNFHRESGKRLVFEKHDDNEHIVNHDIVYIGTFGEPQSLNPRALEVAACGTFQLCDTSRPGLKEQFGDSVETFSCPEELSSKARFYLAHDDLREEMAKRALQNVEGRTYLNNACTILEKCAA